MQCRVEQRVLDLGIKILFAKAEGLSNGESSSETKNLLYQEVQRIRGSLTLESLPYDAVLAGFRRLHEPLGKIGRRWMSSPENMISTILRGRDLPSINRIVDAYNISSLRTHLAFGAHDTKMINGERITFRIVDGTEHYHPIGAAQPDSVVCGEYAYCDDENNVICRLEVRQVEKTKITPLSTSAVYIIQGHTGTSDELLNEGFRHLKNLTEKFCGGTVEKLPYDII